MNNRSDDIYTRLYPLPGKIKGMTVHRDGVYTVLINENLSPPARLKAHKHEIEHIERGDLQSSGSVDKIEMKAHEEGKP